MMRMNKKLHAALTENGLFSALGNLLMYGRCRRAARRFADRVELKGELLLYDAPSGSRKSGSGGRKANLSLTDAETAHNEILVSDIMSCPDRFRPLRAFMLFSACAKELDKKLAGTPFELVLYFDGGSAGTLRLYRVRVDDPSWLSDNIDAYSEPIAVYRN